MNFLDWGIVAGSCCIPLLGDERQLGCFRSGKQLFQPAASASFAAGRTKLCTWLVSGQGRWERGMRCFSQRHLLSDGTLHVLNGERRYAYPVLEPLPQSARAVGELAPPGLVWNA